LNIDYGGFYNFRCVLTLVYGPGNDNTFVK